MPSALLLLVFYDVYDVFTMFTMFTMFFTMFYDVSIWSHYVSIFGVYGGDKRLVSTFEFKLVINFHWAKRAKMVGLFFLKRFSKITVSLNFNQQS